MRKSFLDFVAERNNKQLIKEAFRQKDAEKALKLINSLLKKNIPGLLELPGFVNTTIDHDNCTSKQYIVTDKNRKPEQFFQINWLNSEESTDIYSIDFFKNIDIYWKYEGDSDLSIYTLGTNISKLLPIIYDVVNNKNYNLEQADVQKMANKHFKGVEESLYVVDKFTYTVYENLSKNIIKDSVKLSGISDIENELSIIEKADAVGDIKIGIDKKKSVKVDTTEIDKQNKALERKDPEQIFKEMSKYISLVIKGLQPALILCGAPGVGKTYRVKKQLKEAGYTEGNNLCIVKGKCTARRLYLALYEFRNKGDIILIDDADSLVGPKADENCINILKAALDSDNSPEGRLVTYGVAGKISDDDGNEVPKKCYVKSGCIVITNYHTGALDTALRNRSFIQDIDFTNKEVLSIINKLLPNIEPELLDAKSKIKSYRYLCELDEQGSNMELSLRTFVLCAKIFKACEGDPDFTDDDAKSMIEEQMKLQYARASSNAKY